MPRGVRGILALLVSTALWGVCAGVAESAPKRMEDAESVVELTIELEWRMKDVPGVHWSGLDMELSEGQMIEAVACPQGLGESLVLETAGTGLADPIRRGNQIWSLGESRSGRVRARLQVPLSAALIVRGGGETVRIAVAGLLEGSGKSEPEGRLRVQVDRLNWDPIEVHVGTEAASFRGMVAPATRVPLAVGLNILSPEPTEVNAHVEVEVRSIHGGEPLWRDERRDRIPTNTSRIDRPTWSFEVLAPLKEDTYVIEVRATWEAAAEGTEGKRLGRRLRRWLAGNASRGLSRRVTLAVLAAEESRPKPVLAATLAWPDAKLVDAIDTGSSRGRWHRPLTAGRSPVSTLDGVTWEIPPQALEGEHRRDRLRGLLGRGGNTDLGWLDKKDQAGLVWLASTLKVAHPGKPHRLTLTIDGGDPKSLGIVLIAPPGEGKPGRVLLDSAATGLPILEKGPAAVFSWLVWPDVAEPLLVVVNRGETPAKVGRIELGEIDDVPKAADRFGSQADPRRTMGLSIVGEHDLDRFGGWADSVHGSPDALAVALNLADYAGFCGAGAVVVPEGLADRGIRKALAGQAAEDSLGADKLDLILEIFRRRGLGCWVELNADGPLPGLPPAGSREALAAGLVQINARGTAIGPSYQPLNPLVQAAVARKVKAIVSSRTKFPALSGVLLRLGSGMTIPGAVQSGLDDKTYASFVADTFDTTTARKVPGLGTTEPSRFTERALFLDGIGRMPWLNWRSRRLGAFYNDLAESVSHTSPGAMLAVVTPGLDEGIAGTEARRIDEEGGSPVQAWRAVGLGLDQWPLSDSPLIVLRGQNALNSGTPHEWATSPDLDAFFAICPRRGVLIDNQDPTHTLDRGGDAGTRRGELSARPLAQTVLPLGEGNSGDELLGHAVAVLDSRCVIVGLDAASGQEERLRRFAKVFQALPIPPDKPPTAGRESIGIAVRSTHESLWTYIEIANDAPYTVRVELILKMPDAAKVEDLGRELVLLHQPANSGRRIVLDLAPFGVTALRIKAPNAIIMSTHLQLTPAVLAEVDAKARELSAKLARMSRAPSAAGDARRVALTIPSGGVGSDLGRSHVHRVLLAAIQAHKDQRFADFARLASSRWASVEPAGDLENSPSFRTGNSSALPSNRRLR